jgi:hypothetical protein
MHDKIELPHESLVDSRAFYGLLAHVLVAGEGFGTESYGDEHQKRSHVRLDESSRHV